LIRKSGAENPGKSPEQSVGVREGSVSAAALMVALNGRDTIDFEANVVELSIADESGLTSELSLLQAARSMIAGMMILIVFIII